MDRMTAVSDKSARSAKSNRSREERSVSMLPYSNIEPIFEEDSVKGF